MQWMLKVEKQQKQQQKMMMMMMKKNERGDVIFSRIQHIFASFQPNSVSICCSQFLFYRITAVCCCSRNK